MLALQGYYDGQKIQTSEAIPAKKNQKVIITVLDEFIEETPAKKKNSARGLLSEYADTKLWEKEKTAWEKFELDAQETNSIRLKLLVKRHPSGCQYYRSGNTL